MDLGLQGKVIFITGGSRGLGLACARAFAQEGARVCIASRNADSVQAAVATLRSEGHEVHAECIDMNDTEAVHAGVARIEATVGPIDVLVNSAGAAQHNAPDSVDLTRWSRGMQDKYFPTVHALDAVVPRMAARGGGAVVNIVGTGGKVPTPTHMTGGAANAALLLVSAAFARSWGPRGVRVNAINPGATRTDRLEASLHVMAESQGRSVDEVRAEGEARIPLQRYGDPEDVAAMAVFLASARASYVSGAVIAVDGGASAAP